MNKPWSYSGKHRCPECGRMWTPNPHRPAATNALRYHYLANPPQPAQWSDSPPETLRYETVSLSSARNDVYGTILGDIALAYQGLRPPVLAGEKDPSGLKGAILATQDEGRQRDFFVFRITVEAERWRVASPATGAGKAYRREECGALYNEGLGALPMTTLRAILGSMSAKTGEMLRRLGVDVDNAKKTQLLLAEGAKEAGDEDESV